MAKLDLPQRRSLALVLPALHLALCLAIEAGWLEFEGSWGGFVIFLIDLPFSILLLLLSTVLPSMLVFAIFGTAWWYLISRFVLYLAGHVVQRRQATDA